MCNCVKTLVGGSWWYQLVAGCSQQWEAHVSQCGIVLLHQLGRTVSGRIRWLCGRTFGDHWWKRPLQKPCVERNAWVDDCGVRCFTWCQIDARPPALVIDSSQPVRPNAVPTPRDKGPSKQRRYKVRYFTFRSMRYVQARPKLSHSLLTINRSHCHLTLSRIDLASALRLILHVYC